MVGVVGGLVRPGGPGEEERPFVGGAEDTGERGVEQRRVLGRAGLLLGPECPGLGDLPLAVGGQGLGDGPAYRGLVDGRGDGGPCLQPAGEPPEVDQHGGRHGDQDQQQDGVDGAHGTYS